MENFAAIDFETANNERTSVCSVGVGIIPESCFLIYTIFWTLPGEKKFIFPDAFLMGFLEME